MLTVENVTIRFGGITAVNNVSLSTKDGQITSLIGPNGAGKTTLFNCISGVNKSNSGKIHFYGERIDGKRGYENCAMGIARTYQIINLFWKMSTIDNILVGMHTQLKSNFWKSLIRTKKEREEERNAIRQAYELLDFVGLADKANYQASSLAYGEQRLLEIARGLASRPKLLLLDEPAAGMNNTEMIYLDKLLHRIINIGTSILMIEHDMNLVMGVTDYVYVLDNGFLIAEGKPEQVSKNPDVIEAYLGGDE